VLNPRPLKSPLRFFADCAFYVLFKREKSDAANALSQNNLSTLARRLLVVGIVFLRSAHHRGESR
jgi:hypothetical protein